MRAILKGANSVVFALAICYTFAVMKKTAEKLKTRYACLTCGSKGFLTIREFMNGRKVYEFTCFDAPAHHTAYIYATGELANRGG